MPWTVECLETSKYPRICWKQSGEPHANRTAAELAAEKLRQAFTYAGITTEVSLRLIEKDR